MKRTKTEKKKFLASYWAFLKKLFFIETDDINETTEKACPQIFQFWRILNFKKEKAFSLGQRFQPIHLI